MCGARIDASLPKPTRRNLSWDERRFYRFYFACAKLSQLEISFPGQMEPSFLSLFLLQSTREPSNMNTTQGPSQLFNATDKFEEAEDCGTKPIEKQRCSFSGSQLISASPTAPENESGVANRSVDVWRSIVCVDEVLDGVFVDEDDSLLRRRVQPALHLDQAEREAVEL